MTQDARDLISKLCTVDVSKRLGNIQGGAAAVKSHPWFATIDWDDLYNRRNPGPIIPHLRNAEDTRNFDDYDPESPNRPTYSDDLRNKFDHMFGDF